jgi:hypothetical protein
MESGCHPPPSRRHSTNGSRNGLVHVANNGRGAGNGHSAAKMGVSGNGNGAAKIHASGNGNGVAKIHASGNGNGVAKIHGAGNGHAPTNGHGAATRPGDVARELISALWERSVPLISDRLNGLDIACEAAVLGRLSPIMRRGAMDTAHKLAGSLGMFGYPRGTELAREIEQLLEYDGVVDAGLLRELVVELRGCLPL